MASASFSKAITTSRQHDSSLIKVEIESNPSLSSSPNKVLLFSFAHRNLYPGQMLRTFPRMMFVLKVPTKYPLIRTSSISLLFRFIFSKCYFVKFHEELLKIN